MCNHLYFLKSRPSTVLTVNDGVSGNLWESPGIHRELSVVGCRMFYYYTFFFKYEKKQEPVEADTHIGSLWFPAAPSLT